MPPEHHRHDGIDGLRGLAAASVIFYHTILLHAPLVKSALYPAIQEITDPYLALTKVFLLLFNGQNAVFLFFVISGLVLGLSLRRAAVIDAGVVFSFVVRRLFRLYPALIACMVFCSIVGLTALLVGPPLWGFRPYANSLNPERWIANATLIGIRVHGASWTIQAELVAIPFVLAGGIVAKRWGTFGLAGLLLLSFVAWWFAGTWLMKEALPPFAAGLLLSSARVGQFLEALPPWTSIVAGLGYLFIRLFCNLADPVGYVAQIATCTVLVGAVFYSRGHGSADRFLGSAAMRFLGRTSYSVYLLNVPLIWLTFCIIRPFGLFDRAPLETGLAAGFLVFACTLPLAALSEHFVERNGIRYGARLAQRLIPTKEVRPFIATQADA